MTKTVIFVMDSAKTESELLTYQVIPAFIKSTHRVVAVTSAQLSVNTVTSLGSPSQIPLIQFYLAAGSSTHYQIIRELNSLGYIISIALNSSSSNASSSYCYNLGLTTSVEYWNMSHLSSFYTYQNNLLFNTLATEAGKFIEFKPDGNNFGISLQNNSVHPDFVKVARVSAGVSDISFGYLPKGTLSINGFTLKAPILFTGFLYTSSSVLPIFDKIVQDIYDFCDLNIIPPFKIEGTVKDSNGSPLMRSIRIYKQSTGMLLGSSESKEDGTYSIGVLQEEPVYVVCTSNDSTKRNQIIGPLMPIASS